MFDTSVTFHNHFRIFLRIVILFDNKLRFELDHLIFRTFESLTGDVF